MKYHLFNSRAWVLRALLATLALTIGGAAFAFNLQILAAEVSMTSSLTVTDCPPFEEEGVEVICLLGESRYGSRGVELARSSVQLAATKARLTPFQAWTPKDNAISAAWVTSDAAVGLVALISQHDDFFVVSLLRIVY